MQRRGILPGAELGGGPDAAAGQNDRLIWKM